MGNVVGENVVLKGVGTKVLVKIIGDDDDDKKEGGGDLLDDGAGDKVGSGTALSTSIVVGGDCRMDGAGDTVGKGKELPTNIDMAGAGVIVVAVAVAVAVETLDEMVITDGTGVGTRVVNCSGAVGEKV